MENKYEDTSASLSLPKEPEIPSVVPSISNLDDKPVVTKLSFNDYDSVLHMDSGAEEKINAPKTIERLEEISAERAFQRKLEEEEEELEDRIKISSDLVDLGELGIMNIDGTPVVSPSPSTSTSEDHISLDDIIKTL